ncbi:MAG TPA: sulfur carrier protein ThiS [Candidatus Tenderia sp.]|nr:sulfur carrier protein ThiS [Candidatus Tenderia sp.]
MEIVINGESREVVQGYTVAQLIADQGLAGRRLAVEVNREIVPRSSHAAHQLQAGDHVEIVHAIGGG